MRKVIASLAVAAAISIPVSAFAATVDSSLIPDGTYTVKVEKVVDSQHITVMMPNGMETTLAAKGAVSFSKVKPNSNVKISVVKGQVPVYAQE